MTEERIKELAEKCYSGLPAWNNEDNAIHTISAYLRTVAVEARQEGIEEFYAYLIKIHPASLEQIANLMNELLEKKNV